VDEERNEQEQGSEEMEDLEVSSDEAEDVKGGLGIRQNPADRQGK
jgi:hypothetical protein